MDPDGRGSGKEPERVTKGKTITRVYCRGKKYISITELKETDFSHMQLYLKNNLSKKDTNDILKYYTF